jgi:uncharacterized membrane protein YedE/YeeE
MFPIKGEAALVLAVIFGFAFGWLLHRGKVTSYNVIVNQFRFRDFTVLKVMMTAIIVGGVGVLILKDVGLAKLHIRDANMLGTIVGAAIFGVGMVLYGYCPGTGVAAVATGSVHALVGVLGMLIGAVLYAFSFSWVKTNILSVWALGKVSLPQLWGVSPWVLYGALAVGAGLLFYWAEKQKI